jgi:GxxExxY protein
LNPVKHCRKDIFLHDQILRAADSAARKCGHTLGPGLLESIYEEALCREFDLRNIRYERQPALDVIYKGHVIKGLRVDILVEGSVVVEIKSVSNLPEVALAQVLSYLKATGLKRGLLLNFGRPKMSEGIKRVAY